MTSTKIPTMRELMGEGEFPFFLEHVIGRLEAERIFAPWLPLDEEGQVSSAAARELFASWYEAGLVERMAQPADDKRPIHTAVRSFGGAYFFGGQNIKLDEGASPFPPAIFGQDCIVRSGARLGGPLVIGDKVQVGSSHLSRTVVFSGTRIASNVTIGDSVIGPDSVIEAGVSIRSRTGRRRSGHILSRAFIAPRHEDVQTNRQVLGAVIGAGCTVEADLEPGTVLLPKCHVRAWMKGLPAGIYTAKILDALHRNWEAHLLGHIVEIVMPTLSQER